MKKRGKWKNVFHTKALGMLVVIKVLEIYSYTIIPIITLVKIVQNNTCKHSKSILQISCTLGKVM